MLWNYHYVSSSKLTTLTIVWFESFLSLYLIFALAPQSVAYGKLFSNMRAEVDSHCLWPGPSQIKCKRRALLRRLLETPHSVLWRWAISSSRERERRGDTCLNHGQSCHYRSWLMSGILSTRLLVGRNSRRKCLPSTPADIALYWGRI